MIVSHCQRWRSGRATWRPARELFDPRAFDVAPIASDKIAGAFVKEHHYSGTMPAARWRVGLYERAELVGVAVFSVPMHAAVLRPWTMKDAVELGRLVLLDRVLANAESWFVARCFEHLRREGVGGVVSFSDPEPRTTTEGETVFAGHWGTTYQSLNATYVGRGTAQTLRLLPDATSFSARAASKIRARDQGWEYAVAQLVSAGARAPTAAERDGVAGLRSWLAEVLPATTRPMRHYGNLKYLWGLTPGARRMLPDALPYPKLCHHACMSSPVSPIVSRAGAPVRCTVAA